MAKSMVESSGKVQKYWMNQSPRSRILFSTQIKEVDAINSYNKKQGTNL